MSYTFQPPGRWPAGPRTARAGSACPAALAPGGRGPQVTLLSLRSDPLELLPALPPVRRARPPESAGQRRTPRPQPGRLPATAGGQRRPTSLSARPGWKRWPTGPSLPPAPARARAAGPRRLPAGNRRAGPSRLLARPALRNSGRTRRRRSRCGGRRPNELAEQFFLRAKRQLRRRLGRAHLGRDMQDQPAEAALAANVLDPHCVHVVCGTLDKLPRTFALLEQAGPVTAQPTLDRDQKHSSLRRRIRELAPVPAHIPTSSPPHSGRHPQNPSKAVMPNRILTR